MNVKYFFLKNQVKVLLNALVLMGSSYRCEFTKFYIIECTDWMINFLPCAYTFNEYSA